MTVRNGVRAEGHERQESAGQSARRAATASETEGAPASEQSDSTLELCRPIERGPWALDVGSPQEGRSASVQCGERLVIGTGTGADVRISDRAVSARHVRLTATAHGIVLEDLSSKNGVYVAGARVGTATFSAAESAFVIGRTTVTLRPLASDEPLQQQHSEPLPGLTGTSLPMRRLYGELRRVGRLRAPVLIVGESGSGKDVVARALHAVGGRTGSYVPLNVGAIAETIADAELFGHRRGAFTGAVATRAGAFEEANGGTLFLDEIAELSLQLQVKLLRAVENGEVRPVGAAQPLRVDVRVVSATWASLGERVAEGRFREDLYHRIATLIVETPSLRQRRSDIPALSVALLARIRDEVGDKYLSSAALARLVAYSWPGNVRELASVLYRASVTASCPEIDARQIEAAIPRLGPHKAFALSSSQARALLDENGGNVSAAARAAGVPRSTFRTWLARAS